MSFHSTTYAAVPWGGLLLSHGAPTAGFGRASRERPRPCDVCQPKNSPCEWCSTDRLCQLTDHSGLMQISPLDSLGATLFWATPVRVLFYPSRREQQSACSPNTLHYDLTMGYTSWGFAVQSVIVLQRTSQPKPISSMIVRLSPECSLLATNGHFWQICTQHSLLWKTVHEEKLRRGHLKDLRPLERCGYGTEGFQGSVALDSGPERRVVSRVRSSNTHVPSSITNLPITEHFPSL